jgi:hypothetical protein
LTVRLEEAAGWLQVTQEEHREVVVELRALRSSATQVWDLVLRGSDETSSLAVSLSSATDLIKGCIDAVASNEVHWGARLALTTTLSHFSELGPELKLLESGCNVDLTKGQLDALWAQMHHASESLALNTLPSVARNSPDDTGGE